jgi:hypothetical protein
MAWDEARVAAFKDILLPIGVDEKTAQSVINSIPLQNILVSILIELKIMNEYLKDGFSITNGLTKDDILLGD